MTMLNRTVYMTFFYKRYGYISWAYAGFVNKRGPTFGIDGGACREARGGVHVMLPQKCFFKLCNLVRLESILIKFVLKKSKNIF